MCWSERAPKGNRWSATFGFRTPSIGLSCVAREWRNRAMARVRVSTTVDEDMLAEARRLHSDATDSAVLDEALRALLAQHRASKIDAAYTAYDEQPLDQPDEWGDLASFRDAAAAT
jgi:hypothetical protein